jgi:ubiquitin-conjugating enzyme E2 D/E
MAECLRRLQRELTDIQDVKTVRSDRWDVGPGGGFDMLKWEGYIHNLNDSRHDGKTYRLVIEFPCRYPFIAPRVRFIDRVNSEFVFYDGEVCMDILKENWSPALTVSVLMESICSLLTDRPITGLTNKIRTTNEVVENKMGVPLPTLPEPIQNTIIFRLTAAQEAKEAERMRLTEENEKSRAALQVKRAERIQRANATRIRKEAEKAERNRLRRIQANKDLEQPARRRRRTELELLMS